MSFLSMMEANLPPGFRFHPRDDELVCDYLAKKISHGGHGDGTVMISSSFFGGRSPMIDVDLNKCEPWDLPELACVGGKEWYLFSHRDRKYASGQRTNRATASGYWKATGKDRHITRKGLLVGMRKTLVFYQGRAPKGSKTDWVMHEFRQHNQIVPPPAPGSSTARHSKYISTKQQDWVLCRIFYKTRVLMISSKPPCSSMDIHEDTCSNSSSSQLPPAVLPPQLSMSLLPMDQNYITFGTSYHQPPPMSFQVYKYHEQVPCFSTIPASSTTAAATMMAYPAPSIQTRVVERSMPCISTKISQFTHEFGAAGLPVPHLGMNGLQSLDCDKKVIRAVLNHLTNKNMEAGNLKREPPPPPTPASLGQGNIYLWDNNGSSFAANCQ